MLYNKIKSHLDNSDIFQKFDQILTEKNGKGLFHNLNRSMKALLIARAHEQTGKTILIISQDDKIAEEYLDDLDLYLGREKSWYLPDYEVLPYENRSPHYILRAQRIETLTKAVLPKPAVFSLSIRSFLRKIVPPSLFSKNVIVLKKGDEYKPEILISNLVGMGYKNEYQVTKVGDIAHRGGIIDIFSPNSDKPVRIEYFGDEIDSIRVFSISSQRSTGEESNEIMILPSREFSIHDIDTDEKEWEKIHLEGFYEGIELNIEKLLPETASFIDYFEFDNCLVFWDEYQYLKQEVDNIFEETIKLYKKASLQTKEILPLPDKIFLEPSILNNKLKKFRNLYLSNSYQIIKDLEDTFEFDMKSQENLHSDLEILESNLNEHLEKGYKIIIQSDNSSQRKRMQELLPHIEDKIDFTIGVLQTGFVLNNPQLAIYTDHEIFSRYKRKRRLQRFSKEEALVDYESLIPGDYIVHIDHGIGIFGGLKKLTVDGNIIECLVLNYANNDAVYVPTFQLTLVSKYVSQDGIVPTIHKLGGKKWEAAKRKAKKQVELVAEDLIKLYAERSIRKGIAFDPDNSWQIEMENSFIFEDTPDQSRASREIKDDMEQDTVMERLLCGDVGFGKTEVAIRAAFKAVLSGLQVAVLVPTTLLAEQHFLVFKERLAQYPVRVAMLSRFRSPSQIKKNILKLNLGEIDIVIGTHRLLSKDIVFNRLGLLIIDEEHRFGVRHKDKLRQLKSNIDTLYMSATPIPRTMYMALSKLKEMSLIRTSPKARLPIRTVVVPYDEEVIKDAINREIDRGGQVFFVHNRVQTIESVAHNLRKLLPNVRFAIGHGQLPEKQLEAVTLDFAHHKFDVLIATTIIESGIDISNANTIIVNRSDMFGLAQLYQMRGRVGRSNRRAYAYLIIPPNLTEIARKRLETLTQYESLGSGYQISMRDMELRGAGALLGTKQSGIINTLGFNQYNRMLNEAIESLQSDKPVEKIEEEVKIKRLEIESNFYFPETYISNQKERLRIYQNMLKFTDIKEYDSLYIELEDRFGKIPQEARTTLIYYKLNLMVKKASLESFKIRKDQIFLEFNNKNLPDRKSISKLIKKFNYPVRFDTTSNLKIIFDLAKVKLNDIEEIYMKSIELLSYILKEKSSNQATKGNN